ncbi:MAG: hypothetical protein Unbinned5350contig1001_17 [Prokaryotic dsDNA virus sp.]|nr:MAG: hypothetical protein Unbinned5350contig1001_17 [Prokaryotic dsDNA virus sp.]|tara:strand:- start:26669 stop:27223 length:555 start_codon:yes stop_codon:yes gene_type:complete
MLNQTVIKKTKLELLNLISIEEKYITDMENNISYGFENGDMNDDDFNHYESNIKNSKIQLEKYQSELKNITKAVFPEIKYSKTFVEIELLLIETEESKSHFLSYKTACNNLITAGLIDDYILCENEQKVYVDKYTWEGYSDEEIVKVAEIDMYDYIDELSLDQCSRLLKAHLDNDDSDNDDLPF